jgi:hypothetical protein
MAHLQMPLNSTSRYASKSSRIKDSYLFELLLVLVVLRVVGAALRLAALYIISQRRSVNR